LDEDGNFIYHEVSNNIGIGTGEGQYKKFDIGLNLGLGFEYYDWLVRLQYNMGMVNIANGGDYTVKNQNIGVSIAFMY
jgi:hypothetical protein